MTYTKARKGGRKVRGKEKEGGREGDREEKKKKNSKRKNGEGVPPSLGS